MANPVVQMTVPFELLQPARAAETDTGLFARVEAGERGAAAALLERYRRPVAAVCAKYVPAHDVDDLVQETMARAFERLASFRSEARFSTWLFSIARFACIDHLRRRSRRPVCGYEALDDGEARHTAPVERVPADKTGVETRALRGELRRPVADAVEALPDHLREVFVRRAVHGQSFREIAEVLSVPVPTAKSRMRYATEQLRDALGALDGWLTSRWVALSDAA